MTLPGGVSPAQNGNSFAANPTRSINFSANGTPTNINSTRIDGAASGRIIDSNLPYIPALEAIQEVNVVTNSFDAEQGRAAPPSASRSRAGSNAFHGSSFEYHADQHLKAYQWAAGSNFVFGPNRSTLPRHCTMPTPAPPAPRARPSIAAPLCWRPIFEIPAATASTNGLFAWV